MYEKWHFFETVDDFHDFSWINGDKIENSKTIVSSTNTYPNILQKFLGVVRRSSSVFGLVTLFLLLGVVRRSSSVFGLVTLFFFMSAPLGQKNAFDDSHSYTIRWGMCVT